MSKISKYHDHKLQTNHDIVSKSHTTIPRQQEEKTKQSNQLSLFPLYIEK